MRDLLGNEVQSQTELTVVSTGGISSLISSIRHRSVQFFILVKVFFVVARAIYYRLSYQQRNYYRFFYKNVSVITLEDS